MEQFEQQYFTEQYSILSRTKNLVNLYNRNIFKTSLYIYIFQDEKMSSYARSIFIYGLNVPSSCKDLGN